MSYLDSLRKASSRNGLGEVSARFKQLQRRGFTPPPFVVQHHLTAAIQRSKESSDISTKHYPDDLRQVHLQKFDDAQEQLDSGKISLKDPVHATEEVMKLCYPRARGTTSRR